jgi:hypothetical protein
MRNYDVSIALFGLILCLALLPVGLLLQACHLLP